MKPVSIKNECPYCFYETDCASSITGEHKPHPGSISICINCGEAGIFDEMLAIRTMTEDDIEETDSDIMAMVRKAKGFLKATKPNTPRSGR